MSAKLGVWCSSFGVALAFIVALAGGCGGDDPVPAPAAPKSCEPGARECVSDSLARLCSPERTWLAKSCNANEKCIDGDCKPDASSSDCEPNTGSCTDATNGFRCRPDLKGFEVVTCPQGSTCREGLCIGACVKGSSKCVGTNAVAVCDDARTYVPTACNAGELCVTTSAPGAQVPTAACKPAECNPGVSCPRTCGDKINPQSDQTKAFTDCVATADGYRYQVTTCGAHESCNPTGSACGSFGQAACTTDCLPGTMRCSADKLGTQVCGADGKWAAAVTPCNPDPATTSLVCMTSDLNTNKVVCADAFCAATTNGATCAGDQIRTCVTGKLGAPTACPNGGYCTPTNVASVAGVTPGSCTSTQCQAGEERCVLNSFQTCDNGKWATPTPCPAGPDGGPTQCINSVDASGKRGKVCNAECVPNSRRCRGGDGDAGTDGVQVCDANGRWGATQACSIGTCRTSVVSGAGAACVAECIPNEAICTGASKPVVGTSAIGTDSFATCSATGRIPTTTTSCAGQTACRKSPAGRAIAPGGNACIECVGPNVANGNELGQVDRRCVDTGGGPGNTASQACTAGNTWDTIQACTGGAICGGGGLCAVRTVFTGVVTNFSRGALQGWTECFTSTYSNTASMSSVLAACPGTNLMLACRAVGSDTLIVAAHAPRADVLFSTTGNTTHLANGVAWYFDPSSLGAWGFAPGGETINKSWCDSATTANDQRMCWQTLSGNTLWTGDRCGAQTSLFSTAYERVILQAD